MAVAEKQDVYCGEKITFNFIYFTLKGKGIKVHSNYPVKPYYVSM